MASLTDLNKIWCLLGNWLTFLGHPVVWQWPVRWTLWPPVW